MSPVSIDPFRTGGSPIVIYLGGLDLSYLELVDFHLAQTRFQGDFLDVGRDGRGRLFFEQLYRVC